MGAPVTVYPTIVSQIPRGGTAVTIMYGPLEGGFIKNPGTAEDQGLEAVEPLYVDITGAAAVVGGSNTTATVQPGAYFIVPPGTTENVSVNAASSGHKFSAIVYQPQTPPTPTPQPGTFPPSGPTTLTEVLGAYLYQQYNDDADLQAFFGAFNTLAQSYVSWFATVPLAVYTSPLIAGTLLDWVALGLYGFERPSLAFGPTKTIGPLNTYPYNKLPLNVRKVVVPSNAAPVSDDVFKRIITWNFYKGDGNVFNVRWLKRRLMRFLIGTNGTAPNIPNTYPISVTFAPGQIAIRITVGTRIILGGALYNKMAFNRTAYNSLKTLFRPVAQIPFEPVLQSALEAGVLQLPFQYAVTIQI